MNNTESKEGSEVSSGITLLEVAFLIKGYNIVLWIFYLACVIYRAIVNRLFGDRVRGAEIDLPDV